MLRALPTAALAAASFLLAPSAQAVTEFDQNVTGDVIFGSGNANGAFTTDRLNGVELGLRGKLRHPRANTFNSNGDGSYTFKAGTPDPGDGFSFQFDTSTTPFWNFEWSINTNFDGSSGLKLSDLTYTLSLDADPGAGVGSSLDFDPINLTFADHAIGTNTTGNGAGTVAADGTEYSSLLDSNNVAQNSWSYEFFNDAATALENFDPNTPGVYTISLAAFDSTGEVARTSIDVNVVPVPAGVLLIGSAFLVAGAVSARARRKAA